MKQSVEFKTASNGLCSLIFNGPSKGMVDALKNFPFHHVSIKKGSEKWKNLDFLLDFKDKVISIGVSDNCDLSAVSRLSNLKQIVLNADCAIDFSPLTQLRYLYIYMSKKQGASIGALTNLTHLHVHGWKQKDLTWLSGLRNLVNLYMIDSRKLEDLSGVDQITSLASLSLSTMTNLVDCSSLAHSSIKIFSIEVCKKLKDIIFLSKMNNLLYFGTDLDIPSLKLLSEIQNLKELIFHGKVEDNDVEILKSFPALIRCRFIDKRGYNAKYKEIETYLDKKWGIPNLWNQTSLAILGYEVPEFKLFPDS